MRTYRVFKKNFALEHYLRELPRALRAPFTRFRISAHTLAIERGRYLKLPLEERTCSECPSKIEDEFHALIECTKYDQHRREAFKLIEQHCPTFHNMDDCDKFVFLLTMGGQINEITSKLVAKVL